MSARPICDPTSGAGMPRRRANDGQRTSPTVEYSRQILRTGHVRVIDRQGRVVRLHCIDAAGTKYGRILILPDLKRLLDLAIEYAFADDARGRRNVGETSVGVVRFRVLAYPGAVVMGRMLATGEHIGTLLSFSGPELRALATALGDAK